MATTSAWPESPSAVSSALPPRPPPSPSSKTNDISALPPPDTTSSSATADDEIAWNRPPTATASTPPAATTAATKKQESDKAASKKPSAVERIRAIVCKHPDPAIMFVLEVCTILSLNIFKPHLLRTWTARIIAPLLLIPTIIASALWKPTHIVPASSNSSVNSQNVQNSHINSFPSIASTATNTTSDESNEKNNNNTQQQKQTQQSEVENPFKPIPNAKSIVKRGEVLRCREAAVLKKEEELRNRMQRLEVVRREIQLKLPPATSISNMLASEASADTIITPSVIRKPLQS